VVEDLGELGSCLLIAISGHQRRGIAAALLEE
jgi:hypothetical protein